MSQLIYILLALGIVLVVSLNQQRGAKQVLTAQTLNEAETQLTGAGTEVLERIAASYFDRYNFTQRDVEGYCGHVLSRGQLTAPASFTPCADFGTCAYLEGYGGLADTLTRGDFVYVATVAPVEYVEEANYAAVSGTPTLAKRVTVTVENPYLYLGDDPDNTFALTMSRVFTYGCSIELDYVPYVAPPGTCPAATCTRQLGS